MFPKTICVLAFPTSDQVLHPYKQHEHCMFFEYVLPHYFRDLDWWALVMDLVPLPPQKFSLPPCWKVLWSMSHLTQNPPHHATTVAENYKLVTMRRSRWYSSYRACHWTQGGRWTFKGDKNP
jgi:hypothetical protein